MIQDKGGLTIFVACGIYMYSAKNDNDEDGVNDDDDGEEEEEEEEGTFVRKSNPRKTAPAVYS